MNSVRVTSEGPVEESRVALELRELTRAINDVREVAQALIMKLDPILAPAQPTKNSGAEANDAPIPNFARSPLAADVCMLTEQVSDIRRNITDAINRCQL